MHAAVVTGASFGLGEEFARQLAARRVNLVLVARSGDRLRALADELAERHGVQAEIFPCDLSEPSAAEKVADFIRQRGIQPTWLINNAGFGLIGPFDTLELDGQRRMMMLNIVALVELTHLLLPQLRLGKDSRIINVASTAAFQPVPFFNVYAASKVFVLHFSEALAEELRGTDVKVCALCPGPTPTNFHVAAGIDPKVFHQGQSAADVVRMGLAASDRGRVLVICQRAWATYVARLLPRWVVRRVVRLVAARYLRRSGLL